MTHCATHAAGHPLTILADVQRRRLVPVAENRCLYAALLIGSGNTLIQRFVPVDQFFKAGALTF